MPYLGSLAVEVLPQGLYDQRREADALLADVILRPVPDIPVAFGDVEREIRRPGSPGATWTESAVIRHTEIIARSFHVYAWYDSNKKAAEDAVGSPRPPVTPKGDVDMNPTTTRPTPSYPPGFDASQKAKAERTRQAEQELSRLLERNRGRCSDCRAADRGLAQHCGSCECCS